MSAVPPAKFFVNRGVVGNPTDLYHLLRPLLKQTIAYVYLRGREILATGVGPVERIVLDRSEVSSYFTPLSICLNVDSWEYLEFETGPDGLVTYALTQGDERVVLTYLPPGEGPGLEAPGQQSFELDREPYVQMQLRGLGASGPSAEPDPDRRR